METRVHRLTYPGASRRSSRSRSRANRTNMRRILSKSHRNQSNSHPARPSASLSAEKASRKVSTRFQMLEGESVEEFIERTQRVLKKKESPKDCAARLKNQRSSIPSDDMYGFRVMDDDEQNAPSFSPNPTKPSLPSAMGVLKTLFYAIQYSLNAPVRFSEGIVLLGNSIDTTAEWNARTKSMVWQGYSANDVGWGCVYRSMQMLLSSVEFRLGCPGRLVRHGAYSLSTVCAELKHVVGTFFGIDQLAGYLLETPTPKVEFSTGVRAAKAERQVVLVNMNMMQEEELLLKAMAQKSFVGGLLGVGRRCYFLVGFNGVKRTFLYMDPHKVGESSSGEKNVFEMPIASALCTLCGMPSIHLAFLPSREEPFDNMFGPSCEEFEKEAAWTDDELWAF